MPTKKKTTKINKDEEIVKTRMLDSSMLEMEKQGKVRGILLVIVSLLLVCSLLLNALQYIKCRNKKCEEQEPEEIEKIVISKTINIEGYEFSFDDKWNLNIDKDKLTLSNKDQTANIHFDLNDWLSAIEKLQETYSKNKVNESRSDWNEKHTKATSGVYKCRKCGGNKTTQSEMQTRSADEPMTLFIHCVDCGNDWKI